MSYQAAERAYTAAEKKIRIMPNSSDKDNTERIYELVSTYIARIETICVLKESIVEKKRKQSEIASRKLQLLALIKDN